jgi:polyhydroxyalkanoate synthase subunit PhaC
MTRTEQAGKNGNHGNLWAGMGQAFVDESTASFSRMAKLPSLWREAQRVKKGATPAEVVYEEDRLQLLHYRGEGPVRFKTPLLFVFALVNRPYILDILPNKSVVAHFVKAGFDTYLINWGKPTRADRHLDLDDYVNGYLRNVVRILRDRTGSPQVSLLGYCMGGTMSAMFTALHPQRVKNLILLAAGIDFSTRAGLLNLWSDSRTFDVDAFVDTYGNCPAEFLQACFLILNPVRSFLAKPMALLERLDDKKFVAEFLTMEAWLNDNVPIAGATFRQFVKSLYQRNMLVKNEMCVGRKLVELKRITCPVLNLMADQDDLVPPAQSEPFNDLVGSTDRKAIRLATGHIGLAVSSAAQRELWPQAVQWLGERS